VGVAVVTSLLTLILGVVVRITPLLPPSGEGCDSWYYLSYIREFRRSRQFPIRLRTYVLDIEEQWYPPLFPLVLYLFPAKLLDRFHWLVAPMFDLGQMALVLGVVAATNQSAVTLAVAGLTYALMPTLIDECQSLSSRPFGSLFATIALLILIEASGPRSVIMAGLAVSVVLLGHKLSSQLLFVALPLLSLVTTDWRYVSALAAGIVLAFVLSGGFYRKVLLGHLDILRFWSRNHYYYTAHQFADSPIYGKGPTSYRYYRPGWRGGLKTALRLFVHQPFALWLIALWPLGEQRDAFYWWAVAVALAATLTTAIPRLRFLGEGHRYWKLAALPLAYIGAVAIANRDVAAIGVFLVAVAVSVAADARLWLAARTAERGRSQAIEAAVEFLCQLRAEPVLCLPLTLADRVAYSTEQAVIWGGHSAGFSLLEGFYPVLTRPISEFVKRWSVGALLLDRSFVDPASIGLELRPPIFEAGRLGIYQL